MVYKTGWMKDIPAGVFNCPVACRLAKNGEKKKRKGLREDIWPPVLDKIVQIDS